MAELSSSSSSEIYSSSSSIDSSSSSSSSSELFSESSSSSSESSLSSSSTSSIDSSSSSSSSIWDLSAERLIPFVFKNQNNKSITDIIYYKGSYYACSYGDKIVLQSTDETNWTKFYQVDDVGANKLFAFNDRLFIGTNSSGKIYKLNTETLEDVLVANLNSTIVDFFEYNGNLYVYTSKHLYKYSQEDSVFEIKYQFPNECKCHYLDQFVYFGLNGENIYQFDGNKFYLIFKNQNISSFKFTSKKYYELIQEFRFKDNRIIENEESSSSSSQSEEEISSSSSSISTEVPIYFDGEFTDDEILEVKPVNRDIGISNISKNADNLILGSSKHGRIYSYSSKTAQISQIFNTEESPVRSLLSIDSDTILASIGNMLYLGNISVTTTDIAGSSSSESSAESELKSDESFVIKLDKFDPQYTIGTVMSIKWVSEKGIADPVKIELWKSDEFYYSINPNTENSGEYEWEIPTNIESSKDYLIYIEWLSTQAKEINGDYSNTFRIANDQEVEKETDLNKVKEPVKKYIWSFNPILHLNDEYVSCAKLINGKIFIGTSENRILSVNNTDINAYGCGNKTISAITTNEMGFTSNSSTSNVYYALHDKFIRLNDKEIEKYEFVKKATISTNEESMGVFISEIFFAQSDFGFWKTLIWNQTIDDSSEIKVYLRTGTSVQDLYSKSWTNSYSSSTTGTVSKNLLADKLKGAYAQIKVELKIKQNEINKVSSLSLVYSSQKCEYFFTTMFNLERDTGLSRGIFTANITKPINTEISFGITDIETSDWTKYKIIEPNKFFDLEDQDKFKMGVKLSSYSSNLPIVSEFSILTAGSKIKKLNE